ncbi:MAG: efflux RND transporter periplasmic adaptor subunit [Planctomycetota bacterium]
MTRRAFQFRFLLCVLALAPVFAGCGRGESSPISTVAQQELPPTLVRTTRLMHGTYDDRWYVVSGPTSPRRTMQCGFELGGRVTDVAIEEGATITPGTKLATLDLAWYQRRVEEARLAHEQATADYNSLGGAGAGIFPEADVERARRSRDAARVRFDLANDELAKATCFAPQQGFEKAVVERRMIEPGEVVQPGQPLFTLLDASVIRLEVRVPGRIAALLVSGTSRAVVEFDDLPGHACVYPADDKSGQALVTRIAMTADAAHQFAIEISIANAGLTIRPGMVGRARLRLPAIPDVTIIPSSAAVREDDRYVVWLADNERAVRWQFSAARAQIQGSVLLTPERPPVARLIIEGYQDLIVNSRLREE